MIERPIIFSAQMVSAVLDSKKSQTRHIVKPPRGYRAPDAMRHWTDINHENGVAVWLVRGVGGTFKWMPCPYGQPGDRLWVRETWRQAYPKTSYSEGVVYRADATKALGMDEYSDRHKWHPSIFMPHWASRITLELTGVRVERLQEISEADAMAEGVNWEDRAGLARFTARKLYAELWDQINAKRIPWASNPFVWVLTFRVLP